MDSRELGRRVGLHPNTVRFHVEHLTQARLVRAVTAPASGRGRPRVLFEAVEDAESGSEDGYRLLARILAGYLASTHDPRGVAEEVGRAWGGYLTERPAPFAGVSADEATKRIVRLFTELGFMPEAVAEGGRRRILLHRCPFREVARANPEVVCSVHLGMLRGALAELGAPVEALSLEPMVQPTLCIAHLRQITSPTGGRLPGARARGRPGAAHHDPAGPRQ
jgi:predicted ArsR family transcriptional regulator